MMTQEISLIVNIYNLPETSSNAKSSEDDDLSMPVVKQTS